jgi:alpha-D-xyloside xylohydrolase
MKLPYIISTSLLVLSGILPAAPVTGLDPVGGLESVVPSGAKGFAFVKLENGVQFRVNDVTKNVIFYGPKTVRVNANLGENHWKHPSIVVVAKPAVIPFQVSETGAELTISSKQLRIVVNKSTGALSFHDATSGRLFTKERSDRPQSIKETSDKSGPTYEAANTFTLKPGEAIYGFGFTGQDKLNRRGRNLQLIQTNMGIIIPVMVSTERYGILWDTYSVMKFEDNAEGATLWAEDAPGGVDYYFSGGKNMDEVIAASRALTGRAPMYPKQAFGLFMSKERYKSEDQLLEVARTFRKEKFPLDYIVQDWQYWGSDKDGTWSGMTWNKERYPTPDAMTKELHDMHLKLMVSIWPSVGNDTALAHELDQYGLRFEPLHWISKKARIYDAFSEKGREIYFKYIKQGLLDKGVDALWMDGTEVEVGTACWNAKEVARDIKGLGKNAMGDFSRYLNPYTLMTTMGTYQGQRATSDKRVFTLTRSAWAGAQRTAAASWSGDIFASWKTLAEQISGGLNVCITDNAYWTQDSGGFFVTSSEFPGGEKNPAYRELYARWLQFGAFNPIMRIHGTNIEREPYRFKTLDPQTYESLLKSTQLRYRLLPYTYSLAWKVTHDNYTLMRALPLDFPDDHATHDINDAFLFGPSFLVHPVTRPMFHVTTPPPGTIPAGVLTAPDGQSGLAVQYFSGTNLEKPVSKSVDQKIEYTWPGPPLANPPPGLTGFDNFSASWEGTLTAPEDGEYEIGVEFDDGARLYLGGKQVADDWGFGPKRYKGAKVTLTKGQKIPLKAEFHQGSLDRFFRIVWRTPSEAKTLAQTKQELNTTMETYLPKGADWYDFYTNERHAGGQTVARDCPLDVFPLYVRAGSIVPMGPDLQYATEKPDAPYEIRIYPGASGSFTIYEDDNETYAYEKGQRATYDLMWDDAAKTLKIGKRQGSFPGMVATRKLNIVLVSGGSDTAVRTLDYNGEAGTVKF